MIIEKWPSKNCERWKFFVQSCLKMQLKNAVYFQIGQYIRERIIPKAIWYFTNEVTDIESDLDDGESDEDYSDTSDYVS